MTKICDCGHNQGDHKRFGGGCHWKHDHKKEGCNHNYLYMECCKCGCVGFSEITFQEKNRMRIQRYIDWKYKRTRTWSKK